MFKKIALVMAICTQMALCVCLTNASVITERPQQAGKAEDSSEGSTGKGILETGIIGLAPAADLEASQEQISNPIREYKTLDEINFVTGGKLSAVQGKKAADERYSVIDAGSFSIAEYDFVIDDIPYCYRFASGIVCDISGIYVDDVPMFEPTTSKGTEFEEYETGKAARYFTTDGQYVLTVDDLGELDMAGFEQIAKGLFDAAAVEKDDKKDPLQEFIGSWHEQIAGRGTMEITAADKSLKFAVNWPNSAQEVYVWEFTADVNDLGVAEYKDGIKYSLVFDEAGNSNKKSLSVTDSGSISIDKNGDMHWIDNESEDPEPAVFIRDSKEDDIADLDLSAD